MRFAKDEIVAVVRAPVSGGLRPEPQHRNLRLPARAFYDLGRHKNLDEMPSIIQELGKPGRRLPRCESWAEGS
jgi:hypothetical protein